MTNPPARRPWAALVFLLALCLLAALVWWRVLNRTDHGAGAAPTCTSTPAAPPGKTLPPPGAVTVVVVNSTTTRQGLAAAVRQALIGDGFQSPAPATNDGAAYGGNGQTIAGVAEIRSGTAGAAGAELLAYYLPGATLVHIDRGDASVVVSLGTAYVSLRAQQDVTAALQANGIRLLTPATSPAVPTTGPSGTGKGPSGTPTSTRSRC